jgi:hypothetical protein
MRRSRQAAARLMRKGAPATPAVRTVFPDVQELRVELEFLPEPGWSPSHQVRILRPAAQASFRYPCAFAGCSGWFELSEPIRYLVQRREDLAAASLGCAGVRPSDRATGKACDAQVRYVIKASYVCSKA